MGDHGEVFSSIKGTDIEKTLASEGFPGAKVKLERPLKSTGVHEVEVSFSHGLRATTKVTLRGVR